MKNFMDEIYNVLYNALIDISMAKAECLTYGIWFMKDIYNVCTPSQTKHIATSALIKACNISYNIKTFEDNELSKKVLYMKNVLEKISNAEIIDLPNGFIDTLFRCYQSETKDFAKITLEKIKIYKW